jgi:glycosyltransferase involved in cell wall biosynthesis
MKKRVLIALPGLHRVPRGAEAALENVARVLAEREDFDVTLIGGGDARPDDPYRFIHAPLVPRERFETWPKIPPLRSEYRWEELTFAPGLFLRMRPENYDIAVTCSYPFVHWALRARRIDGLPKTVFVTQNGDWPARRLNAEYRWFACDGLVCTNPEYFERNRAAWRCALIPNGVEASRFSPGPGERSAFGLPENAPVVLMVSALIPSKFVELGIRAVAGLPGALLVVAGDGPQRDALDAFAGQCLPGRFRRLTVPPARMPALYRSADAFLHLSRDEAFGNVYIEALATGLPIVAHDYAVSRWILGEDGRRVDSTDAAALVEALRSALADRADRAALHARAAARFDWSVVGGLYADFLGEVAQA